jgi:hypothetical protein
MHDAADRMISTMLTDNDVFLFKDSAVVDYKRHYSHHIIVL